MSALHAPSLLALALTATAPADKDTAGDANVRIYRCVSSSGAIALQNAPCEGGKQQVLDMKRPQDPPRSETTVSTGPAPAAAAQVDREVRIVTVQPPQPMYECTTAEGERYTSDTAEGNPRWVQSWAFGYPVGVRRGGSRGGGPNTGPTRPPGNHDGHDGHGGNPQLPGRGVVVPYGSVLVRDECHALPPQEVCSRLNDRRWELIKRYNSALQSEREALAKEQRGIDARLQQDCGGT